MWGFLFCFNLLFFFFLRGEEELHDREGDVLTGGLFIVKQGLQTGVNIAKVLLFYIDQEKKQKSWVEQAIKGSDKK